MLKRLIADLKYNFQIFATGAVFSAVDLLSWTDHQYFFRPPQFAGIMNDDELDAVAIAVGIDLMYCTLKDEKDNAVAGILLSIIAGFAGLVAFVQLIHATFTSQAPMGLGLILSYYLLAEVLHTAKTRNTR